MDGGFFNQAIAESELFSRALKHDHALLQQGQDLHSMPTYVECHRVFHLDDLEALQGASPAAAGDCAVALRVATYGRDPAGRPSLAQEPTD